MWYQNLIRQDHILNDEKFCETILRLLQQIVSSVGSLEESLAWLVIEWLDVKKVYIFIISTYQCNVLKKINTCTYFETSNMNTNKIHRKITFSMGTGKIKAIQKIEFLQCKTKHTYTGRDESLGTKFICQSRTMCQSAFQAGDTWRSGNYHAKSHSKPTKRIPRILLPSTKLQISRFSRDISPATIHTYMAKKKNEKSWKKNSEPFSS